LLESGRMRLDLFASFALTDVAEAHAVLDANEQIGKLVLIVDPELAGSTSHGRICS
jgi:NADPH:quinone reductase